MTDAFPFSAARWTFLTKQPTTQLSTCYLRRLGIGRFGGPAPTFEDLHPTDLLHKRLLTCSPFCQHFLKLMEVWMVVVPTKPDLLKFQNVISIFV